MKIELIIDKDKAGNTVYKGLGWFYKEPVELDANGNKVKVKSKKILASVSVPNSVGNRGLYILVNDGATSSINVQLKYKISETEWVFKNEDWSKESSLTELYFIGSPDSYSCNKKLELKNGAYYLASVNKYGYLIIQERFKKPKYKRNVRVQQEKSISV